MKQRYVVGFTLIEVMVGMTVALIGLMVIAGVLAVSSKQKEVTASGADAQTSGAIATYLIERDARMAGYGINSSALLGCTIKYYDGGVSPPIEGVYTALPIAISAGTTGEYGTPDRITIAYSTVDVGFSAPRLTQNNNGTNANYKVDSRFGFHEGDIIVVHEAGRDVNADGIDDCTMAQVTGVPGTPGQTDNIIHNSGNYTNLQGQNVPARYNKPSGLGISYTTEARIYNLGALPANIVYSVDTTANQLTRTNSLTGTTTANVADNIVFLRADYGKDLSGGVDGTIDTYDRNTPTTGEGWKQVVAVRLAVVARSRKRDAGMVSPASLALLPEKSMPPAVAQTLVLTDEQRHYRYKVFRTTVPLRNQIWRPE